MATAPAFAATPNNGSGLINSTADTSYTSPTHTVTIFTAGASGSVVNEIDLVGTGTTVAGVINVFRVNGGVYFLIDSFLVPVVTPSTTVLPFRTSRSYASLILKSGDTIAAASWASNQLVCASAYGGDM